MNVLHVESVEMYNGLTRYHLVHMRHIM